MTRRARQSQKDVRPETLAPEIVEQRLWSLSDWMEKHWRPVLGGLAIVSVAWGSLGIYQIYSAHRERARADATAAVFEQAAVPVVAPPTSADTPPAAVEGPSFATDKARAKAVIDAATGDDPDAAAMVDVLVGGARAANGDFAGLLKAADTALAKAQGEALELPLREMRATALAALGRVPESAAEWAKVAAATPTSFGKALAQVRTGDLFNPRLGSKAADPAKAKAAYDAAIKAGRPGDKDPPPGSLAFLVADARLKLAQL